MDNLTKSEKISMGMKKMWSNKRRSEAAKKMWAKRREAAVETITQLDEVVKPRDEVYMFSLGMEQKLRKRDGYGGWRHLPLDYLERKLMAELNELAIAMKYESPQEVMDECVDVANFVMFVWDVMRTQKDKREGLVRRNSKDKVHV
jgi:phosphoribosyl-ATP pyrophosphohydrolase